MREITYAIGVLAFVCTTQAVAQRRTSPETIVQISTASNSPNVTRIQGNVTIIYNCFLRDTIYPDWGPPFYLSSLGNATFSGMLEPWKDSSALFANDLQIGTEANRSEAGMVYWPSFASPATMKPDWYQSALRSLETPENISGSDAKPWNLGINQGKELSLTYEASTSLFKPFSDNNPEQLLAGSPSDFLSSSGTNAPPNIRLTLITSSSDEPVPGPEWLKHLGDGSAGYESNGVFLGLKSYDTNVFGQTNPPSTASTTWNVINGPISYGSSLSLTPPQAGGNYGQEFGLPSYPWPSTDIGGVALPIANLDSGMDAVSLNDELKALKEKGKRVASWTIVYEDDPTANSKTP